MNTDVSILFWSICTASELVSLKVGTGNNLYWFDFLASSNIYETSSESYWGEETRADIENEIMYLRKSTQNTLFLGEFSMSGRSKVPNCIGCMDKERYCLSSSSFVICATEMGLDEIILRKRSSYDNDASGYCSFCGHFHIYGSKTRVQTYCFMWLPYNGPF